MSELQEEFYLHRTLDLAKIHRGFCAPNPAVGALVVREKEIIATGYHLGPGHPHAEINALAKCDADLSHATLYISLEPCCHFGRTPPCTDAIIQSGIKHVIYGYRDPNPLVAGKGEAALKAANVQCEFLPLAEINSFYESYTHWHQTKKPFVTAKIAMTLDGKIAAKQGERIQITGEAANEFTHFFRKNSDAILTTAKTISSDDPQFNARYENDIHAKPIYILDSHLSLLPNAQIFQTAKSITVFYSKEESHRKAELTKLGVRCVQVRAGLDLQDVLTQIGEDGVHDLWVETGAACFASFLQGGLLNRAFIYIAPWVQGEGVLAFTKAVDFRKNQIHWEQLGNDVLCEIHW